MGTFRTQWRRELAAYFLSPIAYVVTIFFLLIMGFNFYLLVDLMSRERVTIPDVMEQLFASAPFFWPTLMIVVPLITMRLFAEEHRSGTLETLMTAPVTDRMVVLAKYAGALTFFILMWAATIPYAFILEALSEEAAPLDPGPVLGGYLGTLLLGMFWLAVGLFCSALTRNQVVAAVACFAFLALGFGFGLIHYFTSDDLLRELSAYLSPLLHQRTFVHGVVDTRPVVLYLSGTLFMLAVTTRMLEARRW